MVKSIYEFLFYTFYRWSNRVNGKDNFHVYYASLMLGLILFFNVAILLIILGLVIGYPILLVITEVPKFILGIAVVAYFWMHYYYFKNRNRYLRVIDDYDDGNGSPGAFRNKGVIVYVVCTLLGLVILLFFQGS